MQKKFNPQPGDKIICNNGKDFICCTLEFLHQAVSPWVRSDKPILGYFKDEEEWQDWYEDGRCISVSNGQGLLDIREVIPVEPNEVVEQDNEPRYTVEEVTEAFANALHLSWVGGRQKGINKVKDYLSKKHNPEYQEYLRLKAIYE